MAKPDISKDFQMGIFSVVNLPLADLGNPGSITLHHLNVDEIFKESNQTLWTNCEGCEGETMKRGGKHFIRF